MTVSNCGKNRGCFRSCTTEPQCPIEEVDYFVTMDTMTSDDSIGENEVLFRIGGNLMENQQEYIGIGLGKDAKNLKTQIL